MSTYHIVGIISALLSILASAGLAAQVRFLWKRHRERQEGQSISEGLSLNRFVTSFIVFLAMFTYGGLLNPFNHYLVWPRVIGIILVLLILWIIYCDRKCSGSAWSFIACLSASLVSVLVVAFERPIENPNMIVLPVLVVIVSLLYLQGGIVQIQMIRSSRQTGGLSCGMHQLFVLKDISLVTFAVAMGVRDGWPILFTCAIGLTVNITTLWCFRWVQLSSAQMSVSRS